MRALAVLLLVVTAFTALYLALTSSLLRLLLAAYVFMGLAFSAVSYIVYYKKLEFLAAGSVHAALFTVALGVLLEALTGVSYYVYALLTGLLIVCAAGFASGRLISPEKASAIVVSSTSATAVLLSYYILTRMPGRVSLSALILGDPLLLTELEAYAAIASSLAVLAATLAIRLVLVEISADSVGARLAGASTVLYELVAYMLIAFTTVGLLKLAGYVMEHVLLMLPAISAAVASKSTREHFALTLLYGAFSSSTGFLLARVFGASPTGLTGVVLILLLLVSYLWRR